MKLAWGHALAASVSVDFLVDGMTTWVEASLSSRLCAAHCAAFDGLCWAPAHWPAAMWPRAYAQYVLLSALPSPSVARSEHVQHAVLLLLHWWTE
eukprot:1904197-Amphidinium_carterae.1